MTAAFMVKSKAIRKGTRGPDPEGRGPMASRSASRVTSNPGDFDEVALIEAARHRAYQAVNTELVGLYWQLGEYISEKIASAVWGDSVVEALAATIAREYPGMRASRDGTCSACGSSTRRIAVRRKCHRC